MGDDPFAEKALEQLDRVYTTARRICDTPQEAEDLVQEVYAEAFEKREILRNLDRMGVWLHRILHGRHIDHLRRKQRTPQLVTVDQLENYDDLPRLDPPEDFEPDIFKNIFPEEVERALTDLPGEQREVLVLREIGDFTYEEISEVTGAPIGTVRSRLARARKSMWTDLLAYAKEHGWVREREERKDGSA